MKLSSIVKSIEISVGQTCFGPADSSDLDFLKKSNFPADIKQFYEKYNPVDIIEINNVRLLPISVIIDEITNYTPGYILLQYGYIVLASTIEGDVYCVKVFDDHYSIVLASHDEIEEDQTELLNLKYTKEVTQTFTEFLNLFLNHGLPSSFNDGG